MASEPGKRQTLLAADVKSFACPERPAPCVVKVDNGTAIFAMTNDQRMLSILSLAAGAAKQVDIAYIESKPPPPGQDRIDLLIEVALTV